MPLRPSAVAAILAGSAPGGTGTAPAPLSSTAFSPTWDVAGAKDMGDLAVNAPLALTSTAASSVAGGSTQATLVSDGLHVPTFDGAAHPNWLNVAGTRHLVSLSRVGGSTAWSVSVSLARPTTLPVAPYWPVAPFISGNPFVGTVLSVLGLPSGAPNPTLAYQWKQDGANIAGATGSTYAIVSGDIGHALSCTIAATNASGASPATTAATPTVSLHPADYLTFAADAVDGAYTWSTAASGAYNAYWIDSPASIAACKMSPDRKLQAAPGSDVYYRCSGPNGLAVGGGIALFTDKTTATEQYTTLPTYEVWRVGSPPSYQGFAGTTGMVTTGLSVVPAASDLAQFRRTTNSPYHAGDTLHFEVSQDGGMTWVVVAWAAVSADLYPRLTAWGAGAIPQAQAIQVQCNGASA